MIIEAIWDIAAAVVVVVVVVVLVIVSIIIVLPCAVVATIRSYLK
jgi:hypothetical protein